MASANPVRRVLQSAFQAQMIAMGFDPGSQIQWSNIAFDPKGVDEYVRFTFHDVDRSPKTLGPNPRFQRDGSIELGVFVRGGSGEDRADEIIGSQGTISDPTSGSGVLKAFPYPGVLVRDGVRVTIAEAKPGGASADVLGWWFSPTVVNWTIWS